MKKNTVSIISKELNISPKLVEESLGITKPNREKITAIQATEDIFALFSTVENESLTESLLHKRWDIVSLKEAKRAKNVDEARYVYEELAREQSRSWILALIRWDHFALKEARQATTIEEVRTALNRAPSSGDAEAYAERKWDRFSAKEVAAAMTLAEIKKAYKRARAGSSPRRTAIRKLARLLD